MLNSPSEKFGKKTLEKNIVHLQIFKDITGAIRNFYIKDKKRALQSSSPGISENICGHVTVTTEN